MSVKSWAQLLDGQLDNIGLLSILLNERERNLRETVNLLKERCNHMDRQNMVADISENISLVFY
jgi:hypothetical protein